ncbi:MAG: gliding motility-associated C-terminal domain-containing protein [Saprospiraceae bacterium]
MVRTFGILLFLLAFNQSQAQTNEGLEFWAGFMEHRDIGTNTMVVMITSKQNTSGKVRIPLLNWEQAFQVQANSVTLVKLPSSAENLGSEQVKLLGVQVLANDLVSVYIHQYHSLRSEATVVLPIETLGTEYFALTYRGVNIQGTVYPSEMLLVGTEEGTVITITLSANTLGGRQAGSTFTVVLNEGETYQIQGDRESDDLTGTHVVSDKPLAVFAGARWTEVPTGCNARDNLLEQMYPVHTLGKQFVTVPNAAVLYDVFRILAVEDQTAVTVYGSNTVDYMLNAGEFVEYNHKIATYIVSNKPISVAQYSIGNECNGHSVGDPAMVMLNSIEQIRDTVTLYNSSFEEITENYINVITRTVDADLILVDGLPLSSYGVNTLEVGGNADFSYARLAVDAGPHTLISEGCGLIATAYGYGVVESYAYSGGASFSALNANPVPVGACLGDTISFDAGLNPSRYTFYWDLGDGGSSTEAQFEHQYAALGTYPVVLYLYDQCLDIHDTLRQDLIVSLRQSLDLAPDESLCAGGEITLTASDLPGATYAWTGPDGFYSEQQTVHLSYLQPEQSGEYAVVGTISGCSTYPSFRSVTVYPLPVPDLGPDTIFCWRNTDTLPVLSPGKFEQYQWHTLSSSAFFNPSSEGLYFVRVWDEHMCSASDSVRFRSVCPTKTYIPNAFSPNDDGWNDYFQVFGEDVVSINWKVYDRWGSLLFEGHSLDDRWDGTTHGDPASPGVYIWLAIIESNAADGTQFTDTQTGSLTLIR